MVFAKDGNNSDNSSAKNPGGNPSAPGKESDGPSRPAKLIGDGSTADTGPQPKQPKVEKLKPGEKPPQFVVFSWDGAAEDGNKLVSEFLKLSEANKAQMTYFLSGIYVLPKTKKAMYTGPKHAPGASDINFMTDETVRNTIIQMRDVWLKGNEVGTHFNGHFCNSATSGKNWSPADWKNETEQAVKFVQNWKTNTGFADLPPLPFDYAPGKELIGGRAPCLEGQSNLMRAGKEMGFRYDASSPGGLQVWPKRGKETGIWDFPLQSLPWPGSTKSQLSMDYNIMFEQEAIHGKYDPSKKDAWEKEARDFYLNGFQRAYTTNRAPLFIGNHFEDWNGGIYMNAVRDTVTSVCTKSDVRCVTFRQLTDWLEGQDPAVIAKLQGLGVGQNVADWGTIVSGSGQAPNAPAAGRALPGQEHAVLPRRQD
ncbi:hypothetical protein [Embleya sp. NBC_00896]|uniref:hypothetical protein n=1 Tax=Embleya sp. NBC_00896 TaxID=2975961 RepID=UPI00386375DC|nr:hypothetical protein OG928_18510 [Embleya sp. NBC_00896]